MNGNFGKTIADYAVQYLSPPLLAISVIFIVLATERLVAIARFGPRVVGPEECTVLILVAMLTIAAQMVLRGFWVFG